VDFDLDLELRKTWELGQALLGVREWELDTHRIFDEAFLPS
jgi:hypothetical protein